MNHQTKKGKLIVIDGSDGSGKSTQTNLLLEYLNKNDIEAKHIKFPRYEQFYGKVVAKFLRGEFGGIDEVSPYLASLAYAADRLSAKSEIEETLNEGTYIVMDRYVPSNMGHQGARFENEKERDEYLKWDYEMEYEVNKLPKEDVVVYLYVPYQIASELRSKVTQKEYLKENEKDILEKDMHHLLMAEKTYMHLSETYPHWVKIDCAKDGKILSIEEIHNKIVATLKEKGFI